MTGRGKRRPLWSIPTLLGRPASLGTYFACAGCDPGDAQADHLLGPYGFLARQATRLACGRDFLPGMRTQLEPIAGYHAMPLVGAAFAKSAGNVEFQLDATTIKITAGR